MKQPLGTNDGPYARYLVEELIDMLSDMLPTAALEKLDTRILERLKSSNRAVDREIVVALREELGTPTAR